MGLGLAFWIIMLLALVLGTWQNWPLNRSIAFPGITWLLFLILGWATFGSPIK